MNKRYKGEVDGFWLFIILLFVVVPLGREFIQKMPGGENDGLGTDAPISVTVTTETTTAAPVAPKGLIADVIELDGEMSNHSVAINKGVKLVAGGKIVGALIKSPDGTELRANVKRGTISTVFNGAGVWEITTYDKDGLTVGWHKINVF